MKILRVIPSVDPKGGGPMEGARKIDSQLQKLGHEVEVVCLNNPDEDFIANYPAKVYAIGPSSSGYSYNKKLVPWIKENRKNYDLVIINGIWQYHSFAAWRALSGTSTPYLIFTHGMLDPWFKKTYPLKHIKKWLYWPWAEYKVLRDAKAVIFTSEEERITARESFWLYKCNEAVTMYGTSDIPENSIELREAFLKKHPELRDKKIILFLSRIHEKKGCDLLIEAFSKISNTDNNIRLVMAGPDQSGWVKTLKKHAEQLGISEAITWTGMLTGDLKWGAFYASEIFCLPSHQENFGIVVAEALACGKPVLISNKVNIWREIELDGAGFVDNDSTDGTLSNINRWLALTPNEYREFSERAKHCFSRRFHINGATTRLLEIIKENTDI